jgi:nucleoside recognition membrane protein YjiH
MEFIGMLLRKVFRPIFKVPGRAAVDCAASWIGSGTVGVVITDIQYRSGYYTGREAIAIATGFSVVSFPIVILFTEFLGIRDLFFTLYLCVIIVGVITNMITVRIPPISRKPDTYWDKAPQHGLEENIEDQQAGPFSRAIRSAVGRASKKRDEMFLVSGVKVVGDVWFSLMPIVLALGVLVTVIAEYTPIFQWISFPFIYILQVFGLEEASQAAPSLVVGFADIFLPFILGSSLTSVLTKFVIGVVALVQLIFMTEIGAILLKSPMPVGILDLVIIFLERTLIALPMAVALGYLLIA